MKLCAAFSQALVESTDVRDTALLVIFIRAVTAGFDVVEEYLDKASLSSTTTGQGFCEHMIRVVEKFVLNPAKLCGLTMDGAPSMTGRANGFTNKFQDAVGAQDVVVCQCIIHQDKLCTKVLTFAEVMKNVVQCVNYIRVQGLNHRQFKVFLECLDCDYLDVVYFSAVRWLCRAATLKRLCNLRQEIRLFMESKHHNVALCDENWLNDLAFITDVTQHLSEVNLKLQGKSQLVNKLFEHICAVEKKLELFLVQLGRTTLTHFMCLAARLLEFPDLDSSNYAASVRKLRDEFTRWFQEFRQDEIKVKLFAHPFYLAVDDIPDNCQMELIEL